ncbi:sensor histidine kinase [Flavobacterium muglaense]|uniref:histidine kinase n=1 Tax=Flavobacterium muglaense TaxID=2764716 RepID=A0A923SG33_9FLAO|nr:HAMP domain-containing sensor histidine kinase [Flavobacterium muglaense]MBC5838809.1 HAMP domain-containing histidine kinase [Flavobacterium muglaense]MBC5845307.1 HAMP domain-containing histidine kinase [Flavobacterium muglaense]
MTKNLLYKTSRAYVLFSVLLLVVSAPLFYYSTKKLYIDETDDTLLLHKNEFVKFTLPTLKVSEIAPWNAYNRNSKIQVFKNIKTDTLFYTSYHDVLDNEIEPYRELNATITIEGKPYSYMERISLVETEDLMQNIAILFLSIISLLLLGLFVITKRLSVQLWKPFYKTLAQIEQFEIDKSNLPQFPATTIAEFNRLNASIEKLIVKNTSIYRSQREFIENAAHELQTPLAVFQAKIDSFVQTGSFTEKQYQELSSINETIVRMTRLNKNLLLLSKLENDNYSQKQTINIPEIIQKNIDFFREQAFAKKVTIQLQLTENLLVQSNPVHAEIMISNMFLNAIKHNINEGVIQVKTGHNALIFSNSGQSKALITDKLFNRFSKSNPSDHGNGLGLAIIQKIATVNNWTVSYTFKEQLHSFKVQF